MNDFQFFDITQYLNGSKCTDHIRARSSTPSIADNKRFVFRQTEKVVGAASSIAAANDSYSGPGPDHEVLLVPNVLCIVLVGGFEVVGFESIELGMT